MNEKERCRHCDTDEVKTHQMINIIRFHGKFDKIDKLKFVPENMKNVKLSLPVNVFDFFGSIFLPEIFSSTPAVNADPIVTSNTKSLKWENNFLNFIES